MSCSLYRHYNADGELLYVGISLSAVQRLAEHVAQSNWGEEIARVDVERFATRAAAEIAECSAIHQERPKFNAQGRMANVADLDDLHRQFLAEIDAFLAASGTYESAFGKRVMSDGNFVSRLRAGNSPTLKTVSKVRAFIAANTSSEGAAA